MLHKQSRVNGTINPNILCWNFLCPKSYAQKKYHHNVRFHYIVTTLDNPFWEKSKHNREREERKRKKLLIVNNTFFLQWPINNVTKGTHKSFLKKEIILSFFQGSGIFKTLALKTIFLLAITLLHNYITT